MSLLKLLPITHRIKFKPPVGVLSKGCLARLYDLLQFFSSMSGYGASLVVQTVTACNEGFLGLISGSWRSPGEEMATHSIFLLGEFHRQRSPAGYGPWSHRVEHDWVTQTHESFSSNQTCQDCFCLRSFALSICLLPRRFLLTAFPIWLVFCFNYKL